MRPEKSLLVGCLLLPLVGMLAGCPSETTIIKDPLDPNQTREVKVPDELTTLREKIDKLQVQVERLTYDLRIVAATSQCKMEVQKAFSDLRDLCRTGVCIKQTDAAGTLIEEAGGFTVLLQALPHEVFYFNKDEPIMNDERKSWLNRIASQVAQNTQFMVLAFVDVIGDKTGSPEAKAHERAKIIRNLLAEDVRNIMKDMMNANTKLILEDKSKTEDERKSIQQRMDKEVEKIDDMYRREKNENKFLMGIIDVPLTPKVLKGVRPTDLPQSAFHEPTKNLKRSVWVFRVNC